MSKTHWKNPEKSPYLGSWDLEDYKDKNLTIDRVVFEMTVGLKTNENARVAYFKDASKPMIINNTNAKRIKQVTKSPFMEDWANAEITLYVEEGVKAFGDVIDALRIRPKTKAVVKPILTTEHAKFEEIKGRVADGITLEQLRKHYQVTDELWSRELVNG